MYLNNHLNEGQFEAELQAVRGLRIYTTVMCQRQLLYPNCLFKGRAHLNGNSILIVNAVNNISMLFNPFCMFYDHQSPPGFSNTACQSYHFPLMSSLS